MQIAPLFFVVKMVMPKKYQQFLDAQTHMKESSKEDVAIILSNFPPIKELNADYIRGLIERLSPFTVWKRYGIAKRVLEFHDIKHDFDLKKLKLPKLSKIQTVTVKDIYKTEELAAIFRACTNSRDRAMIEVLYESAARSGELLSMNFDDIEFNGGPTGCSITVEGKTGTRLIPLRHCVPALKAWMNVHPVGKGNVWISLNNGHEKLTRQKLHYIVRTTLKAAGIKDKKRIVHMFRHTRITEYVRRGILGPMLVKLVGWKNSDMEKVYVHLNTDDVENEVAFKMYDDLEMDEKAKPSLLMGTLKCPSCGEDGIMDTNYCPSCGYPLTAEGVEKREEKTTLSDSVKSELSEIKERMAALEEFESWIQANWSQVREDLIRGDADDKEEKEQAAILKELKKKK